MVPMLSNDGKLSPLDGLALRSRCRWDARFWLLVEGPEGEIPRGAPTVNVASAPAVAVFRYAGILDFFLAVAIGRMLLRDMLLLAVLSLLPTDRKEELRSIGLAVV